MGVDALCDELARSVNAVVRLDALARRLRLGHDAVAELVAEGVAARRVELWTDAPSGPSCILGTEEADRRGLVLISKPGWAPGRCRWVDRHKVPRERSKAVGGLDADGTPIVGDRPAPPDVVGAEFRKGAMWLVTFTRRSISMAWEGRWQLLDACPCCAGDPEAERPDRMCAFCNGRPMSYGRAPLRRGRRRLAGGVGRRAG